MLHKLYVSTTFHICISCMRHIRFVLCHTIQIHWICRCFVCLPQNAAKIVNICYQYLFLLLLGPSIYPHNQSTRRHSRMLNNVCRWPCYERMEIRSYLALSTSHMNSFKHFRNIRDTQNNRTWTKEYICMYNVQITAVAVTAVKRAVCLMYDIHCAEATYIEV